MGTYYPPVAGLLKLGYPNSQRELDYLAFGIGPEHIPELIRMLRDQELQAKEPECYAQMHAWWALAQLQASDAIEPLLDIVAENAVAEDFSDWVSEEVPKVLARFGAAALATTSRRLHEFQSHGQVSEDYAHVLKAIAILNPELRKDVIDQLCWILNVATENTKDANAFIVSDLTDLKATEAWPAIERAFSRGCVNENICGDLDANKYDLGLGPEPPPRRYSPLGDLPVPAWLTASVQGVRRPNSKQRFNERQRKKKLEKKEKKKGK